MRRFVFAAALVMAACGSNGDDHGDTAFDWIDTTDSLDPPVDVPTDDASDPGVDPVVDGQGQFRVHLPSEVAPGDGLAMRISHPAQDATRHVEGAPVVVIAPGGLSVGTLGFDEVHPVTESAGVVVVLALLQGGGDEYAHISSGTYDYRGADSKRAMRDVLRYAMGELPDDDGFLITERIPWADTDLVGVVGMSHGGNLVLTTLADHGSALSGLDWFASWESPVGDQYVSVELGSIHDVVLNPYYVPGTCTVTTCPWPGFTAALAWDSSYSTEIVDPLDGTMWAISGIFFLDVDDNGVRGSAEFMIPGIPGPGEMSSGEHLPHLYYSSEMAGEIEARPGELFPSGRPSWMASPAEMRDYWTDRDGSQVIGGQPDHPHLRSHITGWLDAGHSWVRLNPDAAYVAEVSGEPAGGIPESDAGTPLPWPDTEDHLLPET
ncbi:MAG: hypothetical protein JRG91_14560, partial [Deltaproteobacteria bacterium]|nr:hypothetical protein [Deltaproteobacteria bacterium]